MRLLIIFTLLCAPLWARDPALPASLSNPLTETPTKTPQIKKRSEEHTSELESHDLISYAVFGLKKKTYNWFNNDHNAVKDDMSAGTYYITV